MTTGLSELLTIGPPRRAGSKKTADSQRGAVYSWGWALDTNEPMTLAECRALVERVWADYRPGKRAPEVTDGRGTRRGYAYGPGRISLPIAVRKPVYVLHEAAHTLLPQAELHGPRFATLMLILIARYARIDKAVARKAGIEQRPRRVHFAPESEVPQPSSREYRRWATEREVLRLRAADAERALHAHDRLRPQA